MKLKIKEALRHILSQQEFRMTEDALDALAGMSLSPQEHLRVTQLEVALCERQARDTTLDEP